MESIGKILHYTHSYRSSLRRKVKGEIVGRWPRTIIHPLESRLPTNGFADFKSSAHRRREIQR